VVAIITTSATLDIRIEKDAGQRTKRVEHEGRVGAVRLADGLRREHRAGTRHYLLSCVYISPPSRAEAREDGGLTRACVPFRGSKSTTTRWRGSWTRRSCR
jgi:hypothetical protein